MGHTFIPLVEVSPALYSLFVCARILGISAACKCDPCSVLHVFSFMNQAFLVIRRECAHVVLVRMHNMPILDIFDGSLFFFAVSVHNSFRR
jgi:hypothetical protein